MNETLSLKLNPFDYDLHMHTKLSDGRCSVREMVVAAVANGLKGIVITDHVFSNDQAEKLLEEFELLRREQFPIKVLFGCETAVDDASGRPAADADLLRQFDLVLMDCNFILFSKLAKQNCSPEQLRDVLCRTVIGACEYPEVRILAHPLNFGLAPMNLSLQMFDDDRVQEIARAFKKNNKIFEIMNQMYFWHSNVPFEEFHREYIRILKIFRDAGIQFSMGSDTHSCCGVGCLRWCERVVKELNLQDRLFIPEALI